jgi:Flp pilus assembly pilin Flp
MAAFFVNLWREECGQDLIEYTLLITFIGIACLALLDNGGPSVNSIWQAGNNQLTQANGQAAGH